MRRERLLNGSPNRVAGVDGCRGGWVIASCDVEDPGHPAIEVVPAIADLLGELRAGRFAAIGIDMPIGMADDGHRDADRHARRVLGPRRSSLFSTPPRDVLNASDFAEAQVLSRRASGQGMSIQAYNLLPKMRELAACITPELSPRLAEVHPETSFAVLAGAPCAFSKRCADGRAERVGLLQQAFGGRFDAAVVKTTTAGMVKAQRDDIADALIALWTARRIALGTAQVFGDPAQRDRLGFPLTITA